MLMTMKLSVQSILTTLMASEDSKIYEREGKEGREGELDGKGWVVEKEGRKAETNELIIRCVDSLRTKRSKA